MELFLLLPFPAVGVFTSTLKLQFLLTIPTEEKSFHSLEEKGETGLSRMGKGAAVLPQLAPLVSSLTSPEWLVEVLEESAARGVTHLLLATFRGFTFSCQPTLGL